jgi:excinuclease ABC subunit B
VPDFKLVSDFKPTGDQPDAICKLVQGIEQGYVQQTLLGATGTGKTYVMASVVEQINKPALVMAHNKTLAAQLYSEFREFFPTPSNTSSATMTTISRKRTCPARIPTSKRTR